MIGLRRTPEGAKPVLVFSHQTPGIWQDVGKTTPGAINSPVGNWQSLRGGYEATQSNAAGKPTMLADGLSFDGGDALGATSTVFDFGSNNFFIEGHFYFQANTGYRMFMDRRSATDSSGWLFYLESNGILTARCATAATWDFLINTSWQPALNTWYHLAFSRNGTAWNIWRDGVSIGSATTTAGYTIGAIGNLPFGLGYNLNGAPNKGYFAGKMTDITLWNYARYTTTFTPPARSGS